MELVVTRDRVDCLGCCVPLQQQCRDAALLASVTTGHSAAPTAANTDTQSLTATLNPASPATNNLSIDYYYIFHDFGHDVRMESRGGMKGAARLAGGGRGSRV